MRYRCYLSKPIPNSAYVCYLFDQNPFQYRHTFFYCSIEDLYIRQKDSNHVTVASYLPLFLKGFTTEYQPLYIQKYCTRTLCKVASETSKVYRLCSNVGKMSKRVNSHVMCEKVFSNLLSKPPESSKMINSM